MVQVEKLIEGLCAIPDSNFNCDGVYQFLRDNPINVESISKYFFWSEKFYTRNLIFKNESFELMTLCWEVGQQSRVHNHSDQMCWMTVPVGKLRGQNFRTIEYDEASQFCRLEKSDNFDLSDCLASKVELEEPIHQILNLAEFNERAVSLHVYSKPFETCLTYCCETHVFAEVNLSYTSIDGKLCEGISL
jgi:cysteine dioxygenase